MKRFILVTGASSGIGESACLALARQGYEVLAGVRRKEDAERLQTGVQGRILPLLMDVTDEASLLDARKEAEALIGQDVLVAIFNNAGIVINGTVLHVPADQWKHQFDVNVLGVVRVTQVFFPLLAKPRSPGDEHPRRIINMSSVSGLFASPFIGPYAASKYALEGLSDSLRRELYMYDIQVVLIIAGKIATPIWGKAKTGKSYFGPEYDSILAFKDQLIDRMITQGLPVSSVDKIVLKAVTDRNPRLRYYVIPEKWRFFLMRKLPAKWVDRLISKKLKAKSGFRPF
jgi:NAD(P)-dependent dehydrogenase (short-subunit alcohol dehydrogenase family)